MNRTYALVWNPSLSAWSVTDEHARRRGKGAGAVLATALLLPAVACAADLPTGGQVVSGQGQIGTPSANQMVIDQSSNKLAIDWQSFDIAAGNKVTFNQPGSDAIALNRVLGADGSKIMGQLDANGRVFIVNPNGVLFGQGAQVNVGGLVASTLDISNSDFEAGNYRFKGDGSNASVINNGQITAADGGSVALLGGTVSNNGVIVANQGTVALAAGNAMTLDFAGDGLLNVQVDEAQVDALVENRQLIRADGGQVLLTANAGEALLKTVVNNTGVIEARTLGEKDGKIVLLGDFDGGTVEVAGTLDASAPDGGDGGFIETSGAHVKVAESAKVTTKAASGKTGEWLIDPTDFTVSAGKAPLSDSGIGADTLSNNLNSTSVTLQTVAAGEDQGDIHVNAALIWNQDTTLTLNAHNDIHINASITAEHANGKLALYYGQRDGDEHGFISADYFINAPVNLQSGQNFSTKKGLDGSIYGGVVTYTVVNDAAALQAMRNDLAGNYAVGSNIDLSGIANWQPVGDGSRDENNNLRSFTGIFDGLGHTLSNLTINRGDQDYVGLFGRADAGRIRDVGLVGVSVSGKSYVGGLAGYRGNGTISHVYVTGSVSGTGDNVGGLLGMNYSTIKNAYANASVSGKSSVGGLVGDGMASISNAYATGSVTGTGDHVGGLVGLSRVSISNAYASASVSGNNNVGGLVGNNASSGRISNAYATGSVSGNDKVGGLVGHLSGSTNTFITNAYATGSVSGTSSVGGLVGLKDSIYSGVSNAYWDTQTTGQAISAAGLGRTTAQLQQASTFSGWDFGSTWRMPTDTGGYVFHRLPTLQGVTPKTGYQYFDAGAGTADNPWVLASWQQLQNINHILGDTAGKHFVLTVDLDQNSVGYHSTASATANAGAGWQPIGYGADLFAGTFDGLDHTISGLTINRGGTNAVGLFGKTGNGSVIRNIGLVGGSVSGADNVGALVGLNERGSISNAYATTSVSGANSVGGLVGANAEGSISNAYATGSVSGAGAVGGLVGTNESSTLRNVYAAGSVFGDGDGVGGLVGRNVNGSIYNAYVTGNVEGGSDVGGLVGYHSEGFIDDAYVTGNVAGSSNVGGLVGSSARVTISNAYATGSVSGVFDGLYGSGVSVGGLVGNNYGGIISNAYATGSVSGTSRVGGLVGYNRGESIGNAYATGSVSGTNNDVGGLVGHHEGDSISNTYATGSVSGTSNVGGLVGNDFGFGQITASFYATTDAQGSSINNGGAATGAFAGNGIGAGKTREGLTQARTFAGWDIAGTGGTNAVWRIYEGYTGPLLRSFLQQVTVSASAGGITGKTYDGNVASGTTSYTTSLSGATLDGSLTYVTHSKNAGDYSQANGTLLLGGLYSGQQGYDISYANTNASLTIQRANLNVNGITASNKTYDGTTVATLNGTASVSAFGSDVVTVGGTGLGAFADKNAGTGKAVNVSGYTLSGADAGNYLLVQPAGLTASIQRASLNVTVNNASKTYDGRAFSASKEVSFSGFVNGETESVLGGTLSYSGTAQGAVNAGIYGLSASGLTADNYNLSYTAGSLTIGKAALTIAALDASKTFGQSIDLSGYSVRGLVGSDSVASVTLSSVGKPVTAAVGNYAIVASNALGASLANYDIHYVDGTLQVATAPMAEQPLGDRNTSYISVLASNSQAVSTRTSQQAQDFEALTNDQRDEELNLHTILMPEGL